MFRDRHFHRSGRWHKVEDIVPPNPAVGPVISNVVETPAATTATIAWDVAPDATGQIEYGPTQAYGSLTTFEPSYLPAHSQIISPLIEGTLYYYQIRSTAANGATSYHADSFTTTGATLDTGIYGSAVSVDNKSNAEIGSGWGHIAFRFRAGTSSAPATLHWARRTGTGGYSAGNGGTIRIGIQSDDGTSDHFPDNTYLTYTDENPGNPGSDEFWFETTFVGAPALTAGQLYHVVFQNVSADEYADYVSANCANTQIDGSVPSPRHPAWPDADMCFLRQGPSAWETFYSSPYFYTPLFDLALADGNHEGNAYGFADYHYDRRITGTTSMVRERFTVSGGDKTVTGAYVRLARLSGSGNIDLRLENDSGTNIETVSVDGSGLTAGTFGDPNDPYHVYVGGAFGSSHVLTNAATYRLRISCGAATFYARPVFFGQGYQVWDQGITPQSWHFEDGISGTYGGGEYTTNSGGTWTPMYQWLPQDLQFYFTTT